MGEYTVCKDSGSGKMNAIFGCRKRYYFYNHTFAPFCLKQLKNYAKQNSDKFPLKVWTLTILMAPLLFCVVLALYQATSLVDLSGMFVLFVMMILFGTALSLPSLFLFRLLYNEIKYNSIQTRWKKLILALVGVCLIWLTFFLLDRRLFTRGEVDVCLWPGAYSLTLFGSTFLIPMTGKKATEQNGEIGPAFVLY
jgi:uncharacterized membrane-anchored protein